MDVAHRADLHEQVKLMNDESIKFQRTHGDSRDKHIIAERSNTQKIIDSLEDNAAMAWFRTKLIEVRTETAKAGMVAGLTEVESEAQAKLLAIEYSSGNE